MDPRITYMEAKTARDDYVRENGENPDDVFLNLFDQKIAELKMKADLYDKIKKNRDLVDNVRGTGLSRNEANKLEEVYHFLDDMLSLGGLIF